MGEVKKDRKYLGVLYPDSESYSCDEVISELKLTFPEFAYILHDSDVDENGELKKPHIHWVARLRAARTLSAIANDVGVPENMIERCRNFDSAVRYLIHFNDPDKFQYPLESIVSTFPLNKFFRDDEEEQAIKISEYVIDCRCTSMSSLVKWSLGHGCWGTVRRAGTIWSSCIAENRLYDLRSKDLSKLDGDLPPNTFVELSADEAAQLDLFAGWRDKK